MTPLQQLVMRLMTGRFPASLPSRSQATPLHRAAIDALPDEKVEQTGMTRDELLEVLLGLEAAGPIPPALAGVHASSQNPGLPGADQEEDSESGVTTAIGAALRLPGLPGLPGFRGVPGVSGMPRFPGVALPRVGTGRRLPKVGSGRRGRVLRWFREQLEAGELTVGDVLPSERALAEALGLARNTVRYALKELADAGWVESADGQQYRRVTRAVSPVNASPAQERASQGLNQETEPELNHLVQSWFRSGSSLAQKHEQERVDQT